MDASNIKLIFAENLVNFAKNFATFAIKLKHLVTNNIYYSLSSISPLGDSQLIWAMQ
jgi:hypothetical protein